MSAAGGLAKWPAPYGDWVPADPNNKVSNSLCAAFNYIINVNQAITLASVLGFSEDVANLTQLHSTLQTQYVSQFITNTSSPLCADICGQTSYALSYQAVSGGGRVGCFL